MLQARLLMLMAQHPELEKHRKQLINCCRVAKDNVLRDRIKAFLVIAPQYANILSPLVNDG